MTRYVMVADLRRCIGCQTCTAACKQANSTPPGVQWRRVVDIEVGEYPNVKRVFLPTGCQHCANPPCEEVCPTKATFKKADGTVQIDYDLCIGCAYCAVACPYDARFKVEKENFAYGDEPMPHEAQRLNKATIGVAQKCTFCNDVVEAGVASGHKAGEHPDASPACVNSCITGALTFGDKDDPDSQVNQLLEKSEHFRMHEELGTEPGFYYIWDKKNMGDLL
ncbi:MAG: 4Fe-4S dicluster domain-containing protein [Pseudomonadales bacterium]|jgi:phenylacetyl-CoA:acceptor oxidoreductase subunit 1|nr:4Fe-4S dicluster domain-containing protein [Pseudomonadales bacterium]MCP5213706.1 4Fe-4S dicluster domain-containing protein [Pseudomonadales bacterium]